MADLARRLAVARGDEPADLVLTGGRVLSVFTREWLDADLAIVDGWIAGLGDYDGTETLDVAGRYLVPGFIDAHMHLESTKLLPDEFARLVLPLGTTAVVADPHEIANVLGTDGVHWLLDFCAGLPLDVYFMASSCVPASTFESPRRALNDGDLEGLLRRRRVLGLAEMMNFPGVIAGDESELSKLRLQGAEHVDGHAPGVVGKALNAATWHGLTHLGAIAPGYQADLLVLPDLDSFRPELVLKAGEPVREIVRPDVPEWVRQSVRIAPLARDDLAAPSGGGTVRVIGLVTDQVVTESLVERPTVEDGFAVADPERDLAKIAVVERHLATGRVGVGFVRGSGLRRGALASTVAHDAHNLVVLGVSDEDMLAAVARVTEIGGGIVAVEDGRVLAECPLPVAGLLSDASLADVIAQSRACNDAATALGWTGATPFLTMAFLALSVIPALKITDRGLVDVERFELVPLETP